MSTGLVKKIIVLVQIGCMVLSCNDIENKRSGEQILDEYKQAVETANYCSTDAECAIVIPGCPFGCYSPVNIDEEEYITTLAEELREEHIESTKDDEGHVTICQYNCRAIDQPVCVSGRCEIE